MRLGRDIFSPPCEICKQFPTTTTKTDRVRAAPRRTELTEGGVMGFGQNPQFESECLT